MRTARDAALTPDNTSSQADDVTAAVHADAARRVAACATPQQLTALLAEVAGDATLHAAVLAAAHQTRGNLFVGATVDPGLALEPLLTARPADIVAAFATWTSLATDVAAFTVAQHDVLARVLAKLPSKTPSTFPLLRAVFAACADDDAAAATMRVCLELRFDVSLETRERKRTDPENVPARATWTPASLRRMWLDLATMPPSLVEQSPVLQRIVRSPVAAGETTHGSWDPYSNVLSLSFDEAQLATLDSARVASKGDPLHDANFFDHAVRHEVGHAVDEMGKFSDQLAGTPVFGSWKRHSNPVDAIFEGSGLPATLDKKQRRRAHAVLEATWTTPAVTPDVGAVEIPDDARPLLTDAVRVMQRMATTRKDAWKDDAGADQQLAGRIYTYNDYYGGVYSYDAAAVERKLSNYQFFAPAEFFAETFAAYYEPSADGLGALLKGDTALKAWFDTNVHAKAMAPQR